MSETSGGTKPANGTTGGAEAGAGKTPPVDAEVTFTETTEAFTTIAAALQKVPPAGRRRVLASVAALFGLHSPAKG